MALPTGVTAKAGSSIPKLASTPAITGASVTWDLGVNIKPGDKLKLTLKLVADACTTPDSLPLIGQFTYVYNGQPQTVDVCLKKPVSPWFEKEERSGEGRGRGPRGETTKQEPCHAREGFDPVSCALLP
jgi:hypothetical protein